ncbi:MAG: hypothetical protein JXA18_07765 [Chitinispirillaceae bacterium]|nr:hypothetical protein [Chitinispirillaceae bacterium]
MKLCRYLVLPAIFAFSPMSWGGTLSLVGGISGNFEFGWFGEAWNSGKSQWCGDTLMHDSTPDTTTTLPDTIRDYFVSTPPMSDTVITTESSVLIDSLQITTTSIQTITVISDSANDPLVDLINSYTTIIDSNIVVPCIYMDFITDTGGITPEASYCNYYYRFRDWYAQLPFVWSNWQGLDSATVSPYKSLLVTYKGLLPVHRIQINFFYGTWGSLADTAANSQKRGDGVGILNASPEWQTVVLPIPDSVQLLSITGIILAIENVPDGGGDSTSAVGNLKVAEISLLSPDEAVRNPFSRHGFRQDLFHFTPKIAGRVEVSVYSLNGVLLGTKTLSVDPSTSYSVRQLADVRNDRTPTQVRIVKIKGAGVNLSGKIW